MGRNVLREADGGVLRDGGGDLDGREAVQIVEKATTELRNSRRGFFANLLSSQPPTLNRSGKQFSTSSKERLDKVAYTLRVDSGLSTIAIAAHPHSHQACKGNLLEA